MSQKHISEPYDPKPTIGHHSALGKSKVREGFSNAFWLNKRHDVGDGLNRVNEVAGVWRTETPAENYSRIYENSYPERCEIRHDAHD